MNEDELRAFLESATVGGDEPEDGFEAETPEQSAALPDTRPDGMDLPPTEPILGLPIAQSEPSAPAPASSEPTFDELLGFRAGGGGERVPSPGAPLSPLDSSNPAPIVLPGPPTAGSSSGAPAAASAPADAAVFPPAPPRSAQRPQSQPPRPAAAPPTAPLIAPNPPQPTMTGQLSDLGFDAPLVEVSDEYEPIEVTGGERDRPRYLPWIIVGAGAVIALVASVLIVIGARSNGDTPQAAEGPASQGTTTPPSDTVPPSEEPDPTNEPDPMTTPSDEPPKVDVGQTYSMPVEQWGIQVEVSQKFGSIYYQLDGDKLILSKGALLPSFPASCEAMREGFGVTKTAGGDFEVLRPEKQCADARELYDEVWGLTAALVESIKKG